jgi:hypothetical protein
MLMRRLQSSTFQTILFVLAGLLRPFRTIRVLAFLYGLVTLLRNRSQERAYNNSQNRLSQRM